MPYVLETITSRARPNAASHAANTKRIIGMTLAKVKWLFRIIRDAITKRESIMPSRHSREDIRWDRYIRRPARDIVNARIIFIYTTDIW